MHAASGQQYDIVIVGGGMVGAALACALVDSPLRVALVESRAPQPYRADSLPDLRVSAITQASQRIFAALKVWPIIAARRISPFREMAVWDAAGAGRIHFDSADIGAPTLGWIIENQVIQSALWERLRAQTHIAVVCPAALQTVVFDAAQAHLTLDDGQRLSTRLAVAADGADSVLRTLAGITTRGWSYDQQGVVATVTSQHPHGDCARQRFLADGPLALLPLAENRCSIVWSTSSAHAEQLLALDAAAFCQELTVASGGVLGEMLATGPRAAFPLRLQHAHDYVRPRLALIGDAAHCIHPLAGQGVNLGLQDAAALAEVLLDAVQAGRDLGGLKTLRRYERWRKGDNLLMMGVMDGFKRLFGTEWSALRLTRNAGLIATDHLQAVKNLIMRRAMGLEGDLPCLARRT